MFCENGAARFDQRRPSRSSCSCSEGKSAQTGYRQVILGPEHPYLAGGLAMDAPGVGFGQNDAFAYQARAFLEEVAGIDEADSLPRCATFDEGVHNMELLAAVAESAAQPDGKKSLAMKLGVYNAILHDRPLPEALKVIADLGLTGIEINSGGFLPAVHIPTFDDILVSDTARDDYLGIFEGTGVSIAGLNCNGNPLHPNKAIGDKHAEDIRRSIRLAQPARPAPGRHHVRAARRRARRHPAELDRQRLELRRPRRAGLPVGDRGRRSGRRSTALAADLDVKVALELHPQNLVFNTADVRKLVELTGATHVGVELDASHLFWQQMDPVAVVRDLGPLVFQAAAKDVRVNTENAALYGVLDNSFRRLSPGRAADQPRRRRVGQRVAEGLRLGLRRPRPGPRRASTGPSSCARCTRSTRTCWSTSSTRTSPWAASRASRWRPRCCRTPTRHSRRRCTSPTDGLTARHPSAGRRRPLENHEVAGTLRGRRKLPAISHVSGDFTPDAAGRRPGAGTP